MFNLWWGLLFVGMIYIMFLVGFRLLGKSGLFAWVAFATIIANIQVIKTIEMLGLTMTLGNTVYASIYLATDLLNEKYGPKEARKAVWTGFFALFCGMIIMQMVLGFTPHADDFAHEPLAIIFDFMPRLAVASLCAYLVSQLLDVRLFTMLKRRFPSQSQLWIRMNGSSTISQMIDTLVFCSIAFYGWEHWWQIVLTTYLFKWLVSVAATPVLYWAASWKTRD